MSSRAKLPHLLRVDRTVLEFAELVAAMRQDGQRAGWLEWSPGARPETDPALFAEALFAEAGGAGVFRAVSVDAERTVAVKHRRGAPVLGDVLREHFRGCALVLVKTAADAPEMLAPLLEKTQTGWRITAPDGAAREKTTETLVAALRRPHPFPKEIP